MKTWFESVTLAVLCMVGSIGLLAGCDSGPGGDPAGYAGERPLTLLRVTANYHPDLQWVGGRVAAVGVNRGERAALDSTLVWLMTAPADTISRFATVGRHTDEARILQLGGTPADSLADGETYTFWLADRGAFDSGLAMADPHHLADTTLTVRYLLNGRSGGDQDLRPSFTVVREQTLLTDRYVVRWTTDQEAAVRQVGLSQGNLGAFDNLAWHVVLPDEASGGIASPVVLGETPPGAATAIPWEGAFEPSTYVLWMTTPDWEGSFGLRARGYAYFQIFLSNFE